jgi:hypothetical protein
VVTETTSASHPPVRVALWVGLIVAALAAPACKKAAPGSQAPRVYSDDIEDLEAELARNASELQSQGIVIAQRETATSVGGAAEPAETPDVPPTDDTAAQEAGEGDDFDEGEDEVMDDPSPEPTAPPEADEASPSSGPGKESRSIRYRRFSRRDRRGERRERSQRCERICSLADATCDLAEHICALADKHVDDVRYETACDRAADQCRAASQACTKCES